MMDLPLPPPSMIRPPPPGYPNLSGENFCYINAILQFVMLGAEGIAPLLPPISGPPSEEICADLKQLRVYIITCDRLAEAARERRANARITPTKNILAEIMMSDDDDVVVSQPKEEEKVELPPECPISKASMQAILRYYWQDCVSAHIATRKREMECLPVAPKADVERLANADQNRELAAIKVIRLVAAGLNQEFREGEMNDAAEFFELFLTMLAEAYTPAVPATGAKRPRDDEPAINPVYQYYFSKVRDTWTCPHEGCEKQHTQIEEYRYEAQIRPPASVLLEHASPKVSFGKQLAHVREVVGGNCESRPCPTCGDPVMMAMRNSTLPAGIHAIHLVWDRTRPLQKDVRSLLSTVVQDVVDFGEVYAPPPSPPADTTVAIDLDDEPPALPPKLAYLSVIVLFRSSHYVIARRGVLGGSWFIVNDKHDHILLGSVWEMVVGYILANDYSPLLLGYCFEDVPPGTAPSVLPPPPYRSKPTVFNNALIGWYRRQVVQEQRDQRLLFRNQHQLSIGNNTPHHTPPTTTSSSPNSSSFKQLDSDEAQTMRLAKDMSSGQIDIVMSVIDSVGEPFPKVARALTMHNWDVDRATRHLQSPPGLSELLAPPMVPSPIAQLLDFGNLSSPRRAAPSNIMTSPSNNSLPPDLLKAGSGAGRAPLSSRLSAIPKKHLSSFSVFLYMRPNEMELAKQTIEDYGGTVIAASAKSLSPSVLGIVDLNHLERMVTNSKGRGKRPISELVASVAARKRTLFTPEAIQALVEKGAMSAMFNHLVPEDICRLLAASKDVPPNKMDDYINSLLRALGSADKNGVSEGFLAKLSHIFKK